MTGLQFADRINLARVEDATACWEWTKNIKKNGYGRFQACIDGKWVAEYAHRFSYWFFYGEIPVSDDENDPIVIDHICQNRKCVNPGHLQAIKMSENTRLATTRNYGKRKVVDAKN
jgi:hypothetical protein